MFCCHMKKKDWQAWPRQSVFWYDNDEDLRRRLFWHTLIYLILHPKVILNHTVYCCDFGLHDLTRNNSTVNHTRAKTAKITITQ